MRKLVLGIAIAAGVFGVLWWATLAHVGVECEVCIRFQGREQCATAAGADEAAALHAATMTACGPISDGVTGGIQCDATPPLSQRCTAR